MAFVPVKRQIASFPINVTVYDGDGKKQKINFTAQYNRQKKSKIDELSNGLANKFRQLQGTEPVKSADGSIASWDYETDIDFLVFAMAGWKGVKSEDGTDKPFTREMLEDTIEDYPELMQPLFDGFWSAHRQVLEKN